MFKFGLARLLNQLSIYKLSFDLQALVLYLIITWTVCKYRQYISMSQQYLVLPPHSQDESQSHDQLWFGKIVDQTKTFPLIYKNWFRVWSKPGGQRTCKYTQYMYISMSQQSLRLAARVNDNHMIQCVLKERGSVTVDKTVNFSFDLQELILCLIKTEINEKKTIYLGNYIFVVKTISSKFMDI